MNKRIKIENLIGSKFNNLTILSKGSFLGTGRTVIAKCDCGITKEFYLRRILLGSNKSCGCMHHTANFDSKHPLYKIWKNIIRRCYVPTCKLYTYYGAKGVLVCEEWINDFNSFKNWCLANGWKKKMDIDKDIKGNGLLYSPETCSVVTHKENNNYRSNNRVFTIYGVRYTVMQLAEKYNISFEALWSRIDRGWDLKEALSRPPRNHVTKIEYSFGHIN